MSVLHSFAAVEPEVFKEEYMGSRYLFSRRESLVDRLPIASFRDGLFDALGSGGLRASSIRIVRNGIDYSGVVGTTAPGDRSFAEPYVEAKYLSSVLADGYTIVARSVHRYLAPANELAVRLSEELGYPVRVTAYITPSTSRGLRWHFDAHDVFIVQLAGSKVWRVAQPAVKWPIPNLAWHRLRADERDAIISKIGDTADLSLAPGDVLYLPRGYLHAPEALDDLSVHMTVSIHPLTRFDVAKALINRSSESEWWRESVDFNSLAHDEKRARSVLEEITERISQDSSITPALEILWRTRNESREERMALRLTFIEQARAIRDVNAFVRYVRNEGIIWHIDKAGGEVILRTEVSDVRLPMSAADLIDDIMAKSIIDLDDLRASHHAPLVEKVLPALLRIGMISPHIDS
jgi:lysine-specific demethylase/histidyl-hydroxylase NO66